MPNGSYTLACVRLLVVIALLLGSNVCADDAPRNDSIATQPKYEQFLVIPLRVHLLKSKELADIECRLTASDVKRIVGKVNTIWHPAGIHWGVESVRQETAAREETFRLARDLAGPANLALYRVLFPDESRSFDGLHVYCIHKFAVNGVWLGEGSAVVQDAAQLRPVEGGIEEPLPRVTAHELAHALGLEHRQDRTNLLASGTTGTSLNAEEATKARAGAERIRGMLRIPKLRDEARRAEDAGDREKARRLWTWLSEIPGDGAASARGELDRLQAAPK